MYNKTCLKQATQKDDQKLVFNRLSLNAGQKYCRMLQREHSAILLTFIYLPFVLKIFVLSIFEWPLKTDFTCLFDLILYVPSTIFQLNRDRSSWVEPVIS